VQQFAVRFHHLPHGRTQRSILFETNAMMKKDRRKQKQQYGGKKHQALGRALLRMDLSHNKKRRASGVFYWMLVCLCGQTNAMHWYSAYNCALPKWRENEFFICSVNWNSSYLRS
jgi:hypothetical protein